MTNITQEQIDNISGLMIDLKFYKESQECELCGFTSHDENNFHKGICLMCYRIQAIDY